MLGGAGGLTLAVQGLLLYLCTALRAGSQLKKEGGSCDK